MLPYSWLVFPHCCWTLSHPTGLSAVRHRLHLPLSVTRRQLPSLVPFSNSLSLSLSRSLTYFRSRTRSWAQAFVWSRAKTDKGIVCLADHLHRVTTTTKQQINQRLEFVSLFISICFSTLGVLRYSVDRLVCLCIIAVITTLFMYFHLYAKSKVRYLLESPLTKGRYQHQYISDILYWTEQKERKDKNL